VENLHILRFSKRDATEEDFSPCCAKPASTRAITRGALTEPCGKWNLPAENQISASVATRRQLISRGLILHSLILLRSVL
jgi:hypothetical protein